MNTDLRVTLVTEPFTEMAPNSVYLDGAYRGFAHDPELNSYSFDHHGEGPRFPLSAACLQTLQGIRLGADLRDKDVFVSSIDADSVLSTMLVLAPHLAVSTKFAELVREVSQVDAGGPAAADPHADGLDIFSWARPERGEELTSAVLMRLVELGFHKLSTGEIYDRSPQYAFECTAVVLNEDGSVKIRSKGECNFTTIYADGNFGFLHGDKITIGKLPFARVPSLATLWPFLTERFGIGAWGGADAIGGSPFKPEGELPGVSAVADGIAAWMAEQSDGWKSITV